MQRLWLWLLVDVDLKGEVHLRHTLAGIYRALHDTRKGYVALANTETLGSTRNVKLIVGRLLWRQLQCYGLRHTLLRVCSVNLVAST